MVRKLNPRTAARCTASGSPLFDASRDDRHGIPHDHPTLPKLLLDAGYTTAMFGKWHCGWMPWFSPVRAGFQRFYGCLGGVIDHFEHLGTLGEHDLWEGETEIADTGY